MTRKLLLLLLLKIGFWARAAEKVQIDSEPVWLFKTVPDLTKQPAVESISNGYYLELVDNQINLENNIKYTHNIRHIVNESGVQNASEVSVTFSPAYQQVVFHYINLFRNGKLINRLAFNQIKIVQEETDAGDFQYNGLKRAFVMLKDVRSGDRIDFAYSLIGFNPVFDNKYDDKFYFAGSTAVANYFQTLMVPVERKLWIQSFNQAASPAEFIKGSLRIYQWSNPPAKNWESQSGVPSWFDNYPYISVSEYENWAAVNTWALGLFNGYHYALPPAIVAKINEWRLAAGSDTDRYANLATRFVQNQIRYQGLEIGEYTHRAHDPAEVFQHRFGDCKDKALLLAMLLRQENIAAYVALVNTSSRDKLPDALPSSGEFNHAIVAIQRPAGKYLFIDPTIAWQRGELNDLNIPAYGYALVIREGENQLRPIAPGKLSGSAIIEQLEISENDSCKLNVSTTYSGGMADDVRDSYAGTSGKEMSDNYVQYYGKLFPGIRLAEPIKVADDSLKNQMTIKESYIMPSLWRRDEKGKESFDVYAKSIDYEIPDPASVLRNAPIALRYPRSINYKLRITMPDAWSFSAQDLHIKNEAYQFDFSSAVLGRIVTLSYNFKTFQDHISAPALDQYRSDYKKIQDVIDFEFYRNDFNTIKPAETRKSMPVNNVNPITIGLATGILILMIILLLNINRRSAYVLYTADSGWPIGGWLILLGVALGIGIIFQAIQFARNNFFNEPVWYALGEQGGWKIQMVFVIEMGFSVIWLCGAIAVFIWFIRRRDIFPVTFIWYAGSFIAGNLIFVILYSLIGSYKEAAGLRDSAGTQLFRSCVFAAVWGAYIIRSQRVKNTFLRPFK